LRPKGYLKFDENDLTKYEGYPSVVAIKGGEGWSKTIEFASDDNWMVSNGGINIGVYKADIWSVVGTDNKNAIKVGEFEFDVTEADRADLGKPGGNAFIRIKDDAILSVEPKNP
jgi:hypothetical protein